MLYLQHCPEVVTNLLIIFVYENYVCDGEYPLTSHFGVLSGIFCVLGFLFESKGGNIQGGDYPCVILFSCSFLLFIGTEL